MPDLLLHLPTEWTLLFLCALLVGMAKTGIQGIGTLAVPIMAFLFGAKESTGVILLMLCLADVIAVIYYRRSVQIKRVLQLIPWAVGGFFVAILVDKYLSPIGFKRLMAACILFGLAVMLWSEKMGKINKMADLPWFGPVAGVLGGFTTMIGNAAGPIMSIYLLAMQLPKFLFVSTGAWFFLTVNILKLPLQLFFWKNINVQTLLLAVVSLPFIALGAFLGIRLVKILPEASFRKLIIALTIFSSIFLLLY